MNFGMFEMKNFQKNSRMSKKMVAYRDIPRLIDKTSNFNLAGK